MRLKTRMSYLKFNHVFVGLMILIPMATYMTGNAIAARFAPRLGSLRLVLAGRGLAFAAAVAMIAWGGFGGLSAWALFLPVGLAEIGDGMTQPAVMAAFDSPVLSPSVRLSM